MKVLFFAPHSAIWIHAFPEALVAEALQQNGHEIVYVGCGGLLEAHCVPMSAYSVPFGATVEAKRRVCRLCKANDQIIRERFHFSGPRLVDLTLAEDIATAESLLCSVDPESYPDMVVGGVEVGRIALYEMLIQSKRGALDFTAQEKLRYRANLKNVILVLRVIGRLLEEQRPDRVVVYNALYSVNRVVCRLAEITHVPQYYLHAGDNLANRLRTLVLAREHAFAYYQYLRAQWDEFKDRPCPLSAMRLGTDHLLEVATGRSVWAYSAASSGLTDLRERFQIEPGQKVICATMSSDDERFGGEVAGVLPPPQGLLFPRQVDWIRALIAYVETRPDLFLIIRVHPREFPNKREQVLSDHAVMLREALVSLPQNVRVNWPTENISLYDLATITDVFANGWSSAGKEMAWLGLPVVLYSRELALYPADLNYVGTTQSEYFQQIEQALREGWNPEWIRKIYRWCAVEFHYSSLQIADSFDKTEHGAWLQKASARLLRTVAPTWQQERDCRRRAKRLSAAAKINRIMEGKLNAAVDLEEFSAPLDTAQELENLKNEVRRLVRGLFGAPDASRPNPLALKLLEFAGD